MLSIPSQSTPISAQPGAAAFSQATERTNLLGILSFFGVTSMCMLNLNFLVRAMTGVDQALSIVYLLFTIVLLFVFRFRMAQAIRLPGVLFISSVMLFLAVSTRAGFGLDAAFFLTPQSNFYRLIIAQVLTIATAMGARHMVLTGRLQLGLRVIFLFAVMASMSIVLVSRFPDILKYVGQAGQDRSGGFFQDPNRAGQAVCAAAAFGFACLVGELKRYKVFVLLGLALLVPPLFLTYSRSSILAMVGLLGLQFFISPIIKQKGTIVAIAVVALLLPVAVNKVLQRRASNFDARADANLEFQQKRMESLFNIMRGDFDASDTGHRFTLAARGLGYFASSPVIGVGFQELMVMPDVGVGCHNTFIRVLGESGIFGGAAFFGSVLFLAFCGWKCPDPQVRCLVVGYTAMYFCACMVAHTLLTERLANVSIGIALGALSGANHLHRVQERQKAMRTRMALAASITGQVIRSPEVQSVPTAAK